MRDERVGPKGWPANQRDRRSGKVGRAHADWTVQTEPRSVFDPHGRKTGSDYNLHSVDLHAPLEAVAEFDRRVREIDGRDPDTGRVLPEPDFSDRYRGAMMSAAAGEALGHAVSRGRLSERTWTPSVKSPALTEYVPDGRAHGGPGAQLLAFTLEGLIRAHVAYRTHGSGTDPVSAVQHAYQRWLFTQPTADGHSRSWTSCGGPYATDHHPDGWLVDTITPHGTGDPDPGTCATLEDVARGGPRSTLQHPQGQARGGAVVARAAAAAVCAEEPAEAFEAALRIAMCTHSHPDDCLAAGTLAIVLHQQIRNQPFSACLASAREHLAGWPANERVNRKIELAEIMIRDYWVPAPPDQIRTPFGGGEDGAEALGLAVYCAMASDYVREGLQLAGNYATHSPHVAAITGVILGAEYGHHAVPADLRGAASNVAIVDTLARDVLTEYADPPQEGDWFNRYPAS